MQDISLLPQWNKDEVIQWLEKNPLDHKTMKSKLDRIYQITSTNELEYMPDVLDAYCWIRLAHEMEDFKKFFPSQKNQKQFHEDFPATAIRYMIICRKFKNKVMMVLTQYIIIEGIKLFTKKFDQLQKFPKMINILNYTFDSDKQFYKLNYSVEALQRITSHKSISELNFDDSNDEKNDPDMTGRFILRADICSSQLYLALLNFSHDQMDLFGMLLNSVLDKKFNIEATSEVISFLMNVHPFFHRKLAQEYIPQLTQGILDYVNKGDDITIRNFSKQRYEAVIASVREFLKRVKSPEQRKEIVERFQLNIICRFLFSDFLDRKLQAVSILTTFMKYSKNTLVMSKQQFVEWIVSNQILKAIYNQKSHQELISRSSQFLQYYLLQKPSMQELNPLLQLTDANIKLISQVFEYFPKEFQEQIVNKIKQKQNVTNKEALNIMKQIQGCEEWLLKNGGQCWVEVVREKTKRKSDIQQVFNQQFKVVRKITKQISELYEGKFKSQYFLYMNEINYVSTVLENDKIPLEQRLKFAALALDPLSQINDNTFTSILPFTTTNVDNVSSELQSFFAALLDKLSKTHLRELFTKNFNERDDLSQIGLGQISLFKKCFLLINQQQSNIQKKITFAYVSSNSYRKQKKEHLTIKVNPNLLTGMTQLMTIIFYNKNIAVSQEALQFIGFLFDRLDETLVDSVAVFKSKILDSCLEQFYKTEDQQQKYLKIVQKLMNESQKQGTDQEPSVNSLFPVQQLTLRIVDHFNINKSKITLQVPSNLTFFQLRVHIGRTINAYVNEMKIMSNDQQIDPRLNGHVIHTMNLCSSDLVVEKKITMQKVSLCQPDGILNDKVKNVLSNMFKEFSTMGSMSKGQCQKYQQRCIGQITSLSESRVDKIYENYDTDKDGYLSLEEFLKFYQVSANSRQSAVWSNLQTFGVRNDLQILTDQEIVYPAPDLLTRNLLFKNQTFIDKLVSMIQSEDETLALAAWNIISRLPLIKKSLSAFNVEKKYSFRYWLYLVQDSQQYDLVTKETLRKILHSDIQTLCIGLKIAHYCTEFDIEIFDFTLKNMKKISASDKLSFYNKVLLDNSLNLFDSCLKLNKQIRNHFIDNQESYRQTLTSGLISNNRDIRVMYCRIVGDLISQTFEKDFQLFSIFFNLIYKNFQECDKSTLNIEYFDLYSNLLEVLQKNPEIYEKLKLSQQMLARSMVQLYQQHRCTETSLNSKPDHVSQGFLRILGKLLNMQTQDIMIPFVKNLFQNSLFPEHGHNKLKNAKSRKDAYDLIYEICSLKDQNGQSLGLKQLFDAGFKDVYKKMNQNKSSTMSFSSYYYNYNQARSQLGYAGIRNLGCICYMIAMLQQLFMTKAFRYLILMADDGQPECLVKKGSKQIDDNIFHQLKNMFANLELTEKQQYNPDELCFAFKDFEGLPINVTIQQDAQEFINLFFDKMENAVKKTPFRRIFTDVYGGRNCNLTVCSNCNAVNQRYQNFYPLSLQIKGYKSIQDSFRKYITGQVISDYQCDSCKKKTDVTKSCYLSTTPNYFIIHLTRMCFNYDKFENEKVNSRWEFPPKLNIWDYSLDKQKGINDSKEDFQYELKGVVLHYGTADFGHYFSYAKQSQNQWIQFNDQRVRQIDSKDIETDCFGGENFRRQSQSAYLVVYEKVNKRPIILEFETEEQKQSALAKFGLKKAVIQNQPKAQKKQEEIQQQDLKQKQAQTQIQMLLEAQKPKILVQIDPMKITQYVPQNLRQKISKVNEQFSFSLNLSNDEFAHFLYKILSIQPSDQLTTEYLQLCYECFHLKQVIEEENEDGNSLSLSQWAAKRFKQIVKGHGWQFLKNFGKNWQSDILSIQRATRVGIKNLLECVISDIIQSNNLNNQLVDEQEKGLSEQQLELKNEKRQIILEFLDKYTEMLGNEITKHWHRFKQYFDVWITLVDQNSFVRRYCDQKMMIQNILDFVLQDESPFPHKKKKHSMGSNYYSPQYEYPLEFMTLLIKHGYELNEMENRCMKYYAFMSKVINFQTKYFNIIEYLCKNDEHMSQKMAFLILHQTAKVNQSDGVKLIVNAIYKFLEIEDQFKGKRKEWILGIPQHIENSKTSEYGIWGVNVDQEYILTYYSPVRAQPIFLQLIRFKSKAQHVAALLLSMVLQLQHDGVINNLETYPSMEAFQKDFTHWFGQFIESYYEDTHRPYMAKNYVEYGNQLKSLWTERPHRDFQRHPFYLIGKSVDKKFISEDIYHKIIELTVQDITSDLLEITEENKFLNKRNIKNFEGSENFRVKTSSSSYHSTFLPLDRGLKSSDDEENEKKPANNPFDKKIQAVFFKKCTLKNITNQSLLIALKICETGETNTVVPQSAISLQIRPMTHSVFSLYKKEVNKQFGQLDYEVSILGKATRESHWPRQLITPIIEDEKVAAPDAKTGSDEQSNEDWS